MDANEEAEVVLGLLPFTINGTVHKVPELKWRPNRDWQELNEAAYARLGSIPSETPAGQRAMGDAQRELILAYDATHALGDLEDATERNCDAIYDRLLEVAYPKSDGPMALMLTIAQQAVTSALASYTSGQSPTGASTAPTISKPVSRSARSTFSMRRRKSA